MILTRTPLRISFVGGGTDLPYFYQNVHSGAVISVTPQLYIDVWVRKRRTPDIGLNGYTYGSIEQVPDKRMQRVLQRTGMTEGIYLLSTADVPAGTGMGTSAAFLVGALNALYQFRGIDKPPGKIAKEACEIEIEDLGLSSGRQDAYASAYGGLNFMEFYPNGTTKVYGMHPPEAVWKHLELHLLMFFSGVQRNSEIVLSQAKDSAKLDVLRSMKQLVKPFREALLASSDEMGEILHESWILKRASMAGISNPRIDIYYEKALKAGAIGGKLLGAGSGGFLLFYAPPAKHDAIRSALNLQEFPVKFSMKGTRVIRRTSDV